MIAARSRSRLSSGPISVWAGYDQALNGSNPLAPATMSVPIRSICSEERRRFLVKRALDDPGRTLRS